MTNLKSVNIGMNKYCGTAVLSILTGKSTDECANVIRQINGQYSVTGVTINDLLRACDKLGFDQKSMDFSGCSLYRALVALANNDGIYIVMVANHFVCIEVKDKQIYFCDNHTKEPINAASSARLMQPCFGVYQVIERPKTQADIDRERLERLEAEARDRKRKFIEEIRDAANYAISLAYETSSTKESIIREFINRVGE